MLNHLATKIIESRNMAKKNSTTATDTQTADLKIPPHSLEAEQAVLGGLLLDNKSWDHVIDLVSDIDFYTPQHRLIFKTIYTLAEKQNPFDVLTVAEYLKNQQQLAEIGGETYLFELAKNIPSTANIHAYATIVRER